MLTKPTWNENQHALHVKLYREVRRLCTDSKFYQDKYRDCRGHKPLCLAQSGGPTNICSV